MLKNIITLTVACAMLLSLASAAALAKPVTPDQQKKIEEAMPTKPYAKVQQPRRMLVFTLTRGFRHSSIECGIEAMKQMGEKTGAFEIEQSTDPAMFRAENLKRYDAVCFLNTTGELFEEPELKQAFLDYVKGGGGVVGIHAATDCFYKWPEFGMIMGGYFDGHPWNAGSTVTLKVEDPDHACNECFGGKKNFTVKDEIYQFKPEPYSRERLRILTSLDTEKTDMNKRGIKRTDGDFAVSWVHKYGKGRIFYCSLGHREDIYWNTTVLGHYLAGIQFAMGDLEADTTPSAKAALKSLGVEQPLRVFVLTGQSNMQGKGKIKHLEKLATQNVTASDYKHLREGDAWVERDDVFIKYWDEKGPLTVGYGSPQDRIGPELGFGTVVGNKLDQPVLIIKVAWGGQSLARDFRPPSSGMPSDEELKELMENINKRNRERNRPEVTLNEVKGWYGARYRDLVKEVHTTLANISDVYPGYQGQGYELAGLVYFQGFNDVINDEFRAEYGENMINFVRDIRKDLGVADLPIVIGELGMSGVEVNPRYAHKHYAVREAQKAPSEMDEFKGTVAYAETAKYVISKEQDEEGYDGGYHYRGRADTFYNIGVSFGEAMLKLIDDKLKDNSDTVSNTWGQVKKKYGF